MNEAKKNYLDRKTVDDIAKESPSVQSTRNRNLEAMKLKKKFSLPHLTPTQRNIPKIMKRNLSYESEFFTWTFGLPQLDHGQTAYPSKLKGSSSDKLWTCFYESSESLESNSENNFAKPSYGDGHKCLDKKEKNCEEFKLPTISTHNKQTDHQAETAEEKRDHLCPVRIVGPSVPGEQSGPSVPSEDCGTICALSDCMGPSVPREKSGPSVPSEDCGTIYSRYFLQHFHTSKFGRLHIFFIFTYIR
ncbi:hypothetical protein QZH41_005585 [Actinostola sp. cb2023]|nr:hypothetical protein QZH41_005585 [Actinostola sp. cb2023]